MSKPKRCSITGCDRAFYGRGFCRAHYMRNARHGDPLSGRAMDGDLPKFIELAVAYNDLDCLIWPYHRNPQGYATITFNKCTRIVARIVCERVNGPPLSKKHETAHNCGNGNIGCVAGSHLRWATHTENMADKVLHGTQKRGEACPGSKLNEQQAAEIIRLRGVEQQKDIARAFGISSSNVSLIQNRRRWKHISVPDASITE